MFYSIIFLSVLLYVISDILFATQVRKWEIFVLNFFRSCILVCFNLPFLYFFWDVSNISWEILFLSLFLGISWTVYFLANIYSYKFLPAGIATFIISLESVVVMFLWYLFYEEKFSTLWYIWAGILILSWILIGIAKTQFSHLDKRWYLGMILAFAGMFGGAFWWFGFAYVSRETDVFVGSFLAQLSIFVYFALWIILWKWISLKKQQQQIFQWKIEISWYFLASLIYGWATLSYFYATTLGPISLSILFLSFCPLLVWIVAHFLFQEKLNLFQWMCLVFWVIWLILVNS